MQKMWEVCLVGLPFLCLLRGMEANAGWRGPFKIKIRIKIKIVRAMKAPKWPRNRTKMPLARGVRYNDLPIGV